MKLIFLLTTIALLTDPSSAVSDQVITTDLINYLFTNYSANLIPICSAGTNVTLNMDVALRQIMELNEREQILSSNVWLRLRWNDCRLTWDPTLYDNITYVMVNYDDVWVPDITLYDSAAEEEMMPGRPDYRVYVSSSGSLTYNFPTVLKSVCRVNVRYFPFDTQRCQLQFGSWSHHGFDLDLTNRNPSGDLDNFIKNPEWLVDEFPVERHVLYYNCCPEPYPDITYYVVMQRRPDFYLLTMMFPCILTSAVAALTFMLPVESGEKVSLEITVLLSLAVFMLVVSESMPPSSDNFPIIGTYFAASMVLVSLSCFLTIIILNVFYRGRNGRRVPRWAKLYIVHYLGRLVCSRTNKIRDIESEKSSKIVTEDLEIELHDHNEQNHINEHKQNYDAEQAIPSDYVGMTGIPAKRNGLIPGIPGLNIRERTNLQSVEQIKYLKTVDDYLDGKRKVDNINSEWRDLANVMDRIFLLIYSLTTFIVTLAFLLQCVVQ